MSSSESTMTCSDYTDYPDHVHKCLKYVPIYRKGAFSCSSSLDDDDDDDDVDCGDEDVKRILAGHNERDEGADRETVNFSPAYEAAAVAAMRLSAAHIGLESDSDNCTVAAERTTTRNDYEDWDEALEEACRVYPPLGVGWPVVSGILADDWIPADLRNRLELRVSDGGGDCDGPGADDGPTARELRKCLEGALYGQDLRDFVVAQPYCVANKNLDFGKPKMSQKAVLDSKKKVEIWMSKYVEDDDATVAAF